VSDAAGLLVVDKVEGPTSHDVVARLRRLYATRRVGHAGTLDPMATGVLVTLVGEATKLATWLSLDDKRYLARIVFGRSTDSHDATGVTEAEAEAPTWLAEEIAALAAGDTAAAVRVTGALDAERARTSQVPPRFSAIQTDGVRAHARARSGDRTPLPPRQVVVRALRVTWAGVHDEGPDAGRLALDLEVDVGKGYYVRSLACDLGAALATPSTLARLRRTSSGPFDIAEAVTLAELGDMAHDARGARLLPIADATRRALPVATLTEDGARRARFGQALTGPDFVEAPRGDGPTAWLDAGGALVGIGEARGEVFVVLRNLAT
jgi:tRNA pseudouridine55 synthase